MADLTTPVPVSRRAFLQQSIGALAAPLLLGACGDLVAPQDRNSKLSARPGAPYLPRPEGLTRLGLGEERDGFLYVPERYHHRFHLPLMVMLHGAGGSAEGAWLPWIDLAQERKMLLLALDARGFTWDLMENGTFGPDVEFLNRALAFTFARCRVHPGHIALGGFSDGATYALSLGVANGDLFSHLVAFAPVAFFPATSPVGEPRIYVFQGTQDFALLGPTRNEIVPQLLRLGHQVIYEEFDAGHTVTLDVSKKALDWVGGR